MTYATQQDLIDRFGQQELIQLTDRVNGIAIDAAVLNQVLADADAEINIYLSGYLPLASVPLVLKGLACDIARFKLYKDEAPEVIVTRYKEAMNRLKDVAAGKASLGLDTAQQATPSAGGPDYVAGARVFSPDNLADY